MDLMKEYMMYWMIKPSIHVSHITIRICIVYLSNEICVEAWMFDLGGWMEWWCGVRGREGMV